MIKLAEITPLAETRWTMVYQHPSAPGLLIKVKRSRKLETPKILTRFRPSARFYRHMRDWAYEQKGYLSVLSRLNETPDFLPVFHGYCQTDVGIGYVVEKITDAKGNLAPTLSCALAAGLPSARAEVLILEFFEKLQAASVVAGDLHSRNVVVAGDAERLVLVDGLGDPSLIKIRTLSEYFRRRSLNNRLKRFLGAVEKYRAL